MSLITHTHRHTETHAHTDIQRHSVVDVVIGDD